MTFLGAFVPAVASAKVIRLSMMIPLFIISWDMALYPITIAIKSDPVKTKIPKLQKL
jgi:hypothetical protein